MSARSSVFLLDAKRNVMSALGNTSRARLFSAGRKSRSKFAARYRASAATSRSPSTARVSMSRSKVLPSARGSIAVCGVIALPIHETGEDLSVLSIARRAWHCVSFSLGVRYNFPGWVRVFVQPEGAEPLGGCTMKEENSVDGSTTPSASRQSGRGRGHVRGKRGPR